MKYIVLFTAVAAVATTLFVSCAKDDEQQKTDNPQIAICYAAEEFKLTEKDNGKTIKVHTGDLIRITLESNITTGYDWENADKVDKSILKLENNDYVSDPHPEGMVGVGGNTVIVYRALKQGKTKVDLTYMQPWEPDADDIEKFNVTIEVLDRP